MTAKERIQKVRMTLSRIRALPRDDQQYLAGWVDRADMENRRKDEQKKESA